MAELKKLQKNGTDIYPVTLEDVVFDTDGNTLPNKYQTKSDDTLNTIDKTVIGWWKMKMHIEDEVSNNGEKAH